MSLDRACKSENLLMLHFGHRSSWWVSVVPKCWTCSWMTRLSMNKMLGRWLIPRASGYGCSVMFIDVLSCWSVFNLRQSWESPFFVVTSKQDEAHEPECRHVCWVTETILIWSYLSHFPANPLVGQPDLTHWGDTLVGHPCLKLLRNALVRHCCLTLLFDTIVGHSCLTLF